MPSDIVAYLILLLAALTLILVFLLLRRGGSGLDTPGFQLLLREEAQHGERAWRDEFARAREESARVSRSLREEVIAAFGGFREDLRNSFADLGRAQQMQLDAFGALLAQKLDDATRASQQSGAAQAESLRQMAEALRTQQADLARAQQTQLEAFGALLAQKLDDATRTTHQASAAQSENLRRMADGQRERLEQVALSLRELGESQGRQQEVLRQTVEGRLDILRADNAEKLEQMRVTVDEKLQGTLEERLGHSFKLVSDQLEQVHRSVGEMQTLATGVGDLKRVLTNVKARGTWGEVTLNSLLEQVLTGDQYAANVEVLPGSGLRVEYAVRLPGETGETPIWLPIDSKFPTEDYERLMLASERGDAEAVEIAIRGLEVRIRQFARDIATKYVSPPHSTDFGVLFLPTEGLFAEVIRRPGLIDALQRDHRIVVAGPTTLTAFMNSLRMGFRTLAIQKRSSEVWQVLSAVKTEFGNYGTVMDKVKKKLQEATNQVENISVRQRAVERRLRGVDALPEMEAQALLDLSSSGAPRALGADVLEESGGDEDAA